eukprot:TRINITY_DN3144_c0_g1_i4.p1 TRINITY_DN3144_c0_g1~~TRINITY_DN3144_c0_g1_i4.p1  ORF type:complete len:117 (+),score=10.67 TRINITY_DN3144_c0_g1_i4:249-599(+)
MHCGYRSIIEEFAKINTRILQIEQSLDELERHDLASALRQLQLHEQAKLRQTVQHQSLQKEHLAWVLREDSDELAPVHERQLRLSQQQLNSIIDDINLQLDELKSELQELRQQAPS